MKIIPKTKGEYFVRNNKIPALSGKRPERSVIIGFDSLEIARQCFYSSEYETIQHLRKNSATSEALFMENE
ncbi:DUF1330 domain-containing protein [Desulfobotulus pelophilus]|uniref:DUF1330 domain-containing protein n=1 Tax=Desulfobotulus pelophilus TaxID=2823377 RepID=UPI0034A20DFA